MSLEHSNQREVVAMDLEEIRSIVTAESARIAELGEWPDWKKTSAVESIAGRIPNEGDTNAQGFDAGVACALDMIPRGKQRLSAKLHGNYTPEAVEQVRREFKGLDGNPVSETVYWLAACSLCAEGGIDPKKFLEQIKGFDRLARDQSARVAAAKKEFEKMSSTFETATYGVPFGTEDGCIQGAYIAGHPFGTQFHKEYGLYFIGTLHPSLGLEDFSWSKEVDEKGRPKSGPVHGSKQFVKCASDEEFRRVLTVVKTKFPEERS